MSEPHPKSSLVHRLRSRAPAPRREERRTGWRYVVPAVAVCAGLMFGVSAATSEGADLRPSTRDLVGVVQEANHKVAGQAKRVKKLRRQVNALSAAKAPGSDRLAGLEKKAKHLTKPAGLTSVRGSTVTVYLDDSDEPASSLPEGANANWLIVHQQDVQAVVNALWRGGARAMMLMDQRVISTSAVRCVGNTLLLQGRVYSPPFKITAMGDVDDLLQALEADPAVRTYRDYVKLVGLGYKVTTHRHTTFPAYGGSLDLRHAKVPETKEKK